MGVVSAPLHPSLARAVGNWMPAQGTLADERACEWAALAGIAVTPLGFGALIGWFDWPAAFLIMAGFTAILALIWTKYATDGPGVAIKPPFAEEPPEPSQPAAWAAIFKTPRPSVADDQLCRS